MGWDGLESIQYEVNIYKSSNRLNYIDCIMFELNLKRREFVFQYSDSDLYHYKLSIFMAKIYIIFELLKREKEKFSILYLIPKSDFYDLFIETARILRRTIKYMISFIINKRIKKNATQERE